MLKCLPDLVDDFFGRPWVEGFNGVAAAASLSKRLDGNELGKLRQQMHSLYSTVFNQHDPGLRVPSLKFLGYVDRYVPIDITEHRILRDAQMRNSTPNEMVSQSLLTSPYETQQTGQQRSTTTLNTHESRRPAFDWLANRQHSVVLGEPGSGKSALLRYLALYLLDSESCETRLLDTGGLRKLPVWISFARYAAMIKENPNTSVNDYFRDWLHQYSFDDIHPMVERALKYSDVLLLVDGLDEGTSQPDRQEALDRIVAFIESTGAAVICTSRPRGYKLTGAPDSWDTAVIAPMRDTQVQDLATRWFSVAEISGEEQSTRDVLRQQAQNRAGLFLRAVKENRRTSDLARNPLLCHAMIELYRFSHGLPEGRVGIYDKIIELLLSRHPAARAHAAHSETPAKLLGLNDTDLRAILVRIASDLQNENSIGLQSIDRCQAICASFFEDDTYGLGLKKPKAKRLARDTIRELILQYGLLIERSPGDIGFVHLSVQEYLAAEFICRKSDEEQLDWLADVWLQPSWRECVTNWFGIHGTLGHKQLTGLAAQRLRQLGQAGEWQRLQSLELLTELACTDLGIPVRESREIVREAIQSVDTSPFPTHRVSLARSLTLGAIGSGVRDECATSLRRWVPGRPSLSRADLLLSFKSWKATDDLWETVLRGLHDENFHCRHAALDCLTAVFTSWPQLSEVLYRMSIRDPRPEVRAIGLKGLSRFPEWKNIAWNASEANLQSASVELMLATCSTRIQLGRHNENDLQRVWRIWSTGAAKYWQQQDLAEVFCTGWPTHPGVREQFTSALQQDFPSDERQIALQYLLRCYPNDEEVASLVAGLFNRYGIHFAFDTKVIWRNLIANFRGNVTVARAVRRSLDKYKEEYEAIFWHPQTTPSFIVIGDTSARDELLNSYLPAEPDMGRYWIAKALMDGWPDDKNVRSSLQHWSLKDPDTAAPLAEWATLLYPKSSDRRQWITRLIGNASARIVMGAIRKLLEEFPDEKSRKLVEARAQDTNIWYYNRMRIQGWLAREFPNCKSSLETVKRALEEIDGPRLSDFSATYENHTSFRSEILSAAVAATEDVRMTIAATLRDRAIDAQVIQELTPQVFAEESGSVRSTAMIARARACKGNELAEKILSNTLFNELSSLGFFYQLRRRAALAAHIELGNSKRAILSFVNRGDFDWQHLLDAFDMDTSSLGVIIDNWHMIRSSLEAEGYASDLPARKFVEAGYGFVLDQAKLPRETLEKYLQTALPEQCSIHYFNELARRFPRSKFLRDRLIMTFDGRGQNYGSKYQAARLLLEHFQSDADVLAEITARFKPSIGNFQVAPGVLAILAIGWPHSIFEKVLKATSNAQQHKWSNRDRLLVAISMSEAEAAETAATSLLAEPLENWRYRMEDVEALKMWSRNPMSSPVLRRWLGSENWTLSITGLSLVGGERLNRVFSGDRVIERFNKLFQADSGTPSDGLNALGGSHTSWAIHAMNTIQSSTQH